MNIVTTDPNGIQQAAALQAERMCVQCGILKPATYRHFRVVKGGRLHPDSICRDCTAANRSAYDRQYAREHAQERAARTRQWEQANHGITVASHNKRAIALGLPGTLTRQEWCACLKYWGDRCAVCRSASSKILALSLDHWVAVTDKRPDNPGSVSWNVLPLCHARAADQAGCNNSKHSSDPVEWLVRKLGRESALIKLEAINSYFQLFKAGQVYVIAEPITVKRATVQLELFR